MYDKCDKCKNQYNENNECMECINNPVYMFLDDYFESKDDDENDEDL